MDFSGSLIFPVPPLLKRPVELNGPGPGTIIGTATAIPAFFRMQDNRRFAYLRMGDIDIYLAHFHTDVASIAYIRVE
jgi:hypothetical protein